MSSGRLKRRALLLELYFEWAHCDRESCTCATHWFLGPNGPTDLPDRKVCPREVAWRNYVLVRDNEEFEN